MAIDVGTLFADTFRILTFRKPSPAIARSWKSYLAFGLAFTWLAGLGRYWDNPRAELFQSLGLGSVAYVFVLAAILWLLLAPLRPQHWSYGSVLVFVTLTSPPALLYAFPVERFVSLESAAQINAAFLGVVATWRVALLVWFLRVRGGLTGLTIVVATLLPLTLIVVALTVLNLEHVLVNLMAGIRPEGQSAHDLSYIVVSTLALFSLMAAPVLLVVYGWLIYRRRRTIESPGPAADRA